ncbi:MAG: glutaredoxin family protein [Candidatus Sungbacteria bacterium]|nr:glutaredoxin family protein [Candidatus Sungbacteria bacterium]
MPTQKNPQVIIYTTPSCVYCKMAKEFFAKHNVSYEEKNVVEDAEARNTMITKSGQMGVPVIQIAQDNGQAVIIIGFDQARLKELLGIA